MDETTIYALGTPTPSRAASRRALGHSAERTARDRCADLPDRARAPSSAATRRAIRRCPSRGAWRCARMLDPLSGEAIDRGLVVWFEAPNTETGETMAELHLHGGRAVVGGALDGDPELGFCRLAEPGEFTRRAFEHGKLDLTEAEAIADLVGGRDRPAAQAGAAADGWRAASPLRGLAHAGPARAGPSRSGDRFSRRGSAAPASPTRCGPASPGSRPRSRAHLDDRRGERLREGSAASPSSGRPTPASPRCSIFWRAARRPSCRRPPAPRATSSKSISISAAGRWCWPTPRACAASGDAIEQEGVRRAQARAD